MKKTVTVAEILKTRCSELMEDRIRSLNLQELWNAERGFNRDVDIPVAVMQHIEYLEDKNADLLQELREHSNGMWMS